MEIHPLIVILTIVISMAVYGHGNSSPVEPLRQSITQWPPQAAAPNLTTRRILRYGNCTPEMPKVNGWGWMPAIQNTFMKINCHKPIRKERSMNAGIILAPIIDSSWWSVKHGHPRVFGYACSQRIPDALNSQSWRYLRTMMRRSNWGLIEEKLTFKERGDRSLIF